MSILFAVCSMDDKENEFRLSSCFMLCSQKMSSLVSVVLFFNPMLSAAPPIFPILFPVNKIQTCEHFDEVLLF